MSVDSRIMTMKFDNVSFLKNVSVTQTALDKLKTSMNFTSPTATAAKGLGALSTAFQKLGIKNPFKPATTGMEDLGKKTSVFSRLNPFSKSTRGMTDLTTKSSIFSRLNPFSKSTQGVGDLNKAAGQFSTVGISSMTGGITSISKSWVAATTVAVTAISQMTSAALRAGGDIAKALTIAPITTGLQEYELNMNSIQTILSNTAAAGTDIKDVNKALDELNRYSDQTIYNFAEMAKNIGTFTAAGVDLDNSTASIKGIANLAALSGSNSQQAATAMYQLSQEISAGRVSLMGWNSVVNAGMGGTVFQRALAQTAVAMGEIKESAVKLEGPMKNVKIQGQSFRDSIMAKPGEQSWLSTDVLTATLKQFTGDLSDAEIAAMGFNKAQIKAIKEQARMAKDAATKVKTLSQVYDVAKETAQSGWKDTWQILFGDFYEAREMFTTLSNTINGFITTNADARNKVLAEWDKMGGRKVVIEGIQAAFDAIVDVLGVVKDAFRDVFPARTADDLMSMSKGFRDFAEGLKMTDETAENLKRTFRGVFAIFSIAGQIIGGVVSGIGDLLGVVSEGSGGFLDFTGGIGDFLYSLDQALEKSGAIENFFGGLASILELPLRLIKGVASGLAGMFEGFDVGGLDQVSGAATTVKKKLDPLVTLGEKIASVFDKVGNVLGNIGGYVVDALMKIGDAIAVAFSEENFGKVLDVVNTALIGGVILALKNFFGEGFKLDLDFTGGLFDSVKKTLGSVTGALASMQAKVKADIIKKIAIALGILAISLLVLSTIDPKKLTKAMIGLGLSFGLLQGALLALSTAMKYMGALKLPFIIAGIMGLAGALFVMALALKVMSSLEFWDMVQGLIGFASVLGILVLAIGPMVAASKGLVRASTGLLIFALGMNAMAVALKIFASLEWEEMARGLAAFAGSMGIIIAGMALMPKGMIAQAAALLVLSVAINAIAIAMNMMGGMDVGSIAKALVTLGGALVIISGAMRIMPKGMIAQAAALVAVSFALNLIAASLRVMGGMSWEEIAKGLITLAGSLVILAAGLYLMSGSVAGAAALLVAAAALNVLVPVMVILGNLDWITIVKGLVALAGVFVVLGVAGTVLAPVVPVILALAAALVLVGVGLALTAASAVQFATAFAMMVSAGSAGYQIMLDIIGGIIMAIPKAMAAFGRGIVAFVVQIAKNGPRFTKAMSQIIGNMLDSVIKNVPKMGDAFLAMMRTALKVISKATPAILRAGLDLIIGFLGAVADRVPRIVDIASRLMVNFMNGIARNNQKVIQAGVNMIISLINGIANAIERNSRKMGEAGGRLGIAIVTGMANGITGAATVVAEAAVNAAKDAFEAAKDFLKIGSPSRLFDEEIGRNMGAGWTNGLASYSGRLSSEAVGMSKSALSAIKGTMSGMSQMVSDEIDVNPTIAPVLDLTQVRREAEKMSDVLTAKPIKPTVSFNKASDIAADDANRRGGPDDGPDAGGPREVKFEQNISSPKPLDPVEVYRNTKSIITLAEEVLTK